MEYEELRVRIRPVGVRRHVLTVGGVGGGAELLTVGDRAEEYRARWEQVVEADLGHAPLRGVDPASRLRDLGRDVFALLGPTVAECLRAAHEQVRAMQPERGLRLRFDLPPELRALPLETLCGPATDPGQSAALQDGVSLVRSLPGKPVGRRLPGHLDAPSKIRLLVVHAAPDGAELPVAEGEVTSVLAELPQVAVETTVVRPATRERLERALGEASDLPTAVLLIAHGSYDRDLRKGFVHLETPDRAVDPVPADLLSGMLLRAPLLRLIVLNLCSSGESAHSEPFSGLAQALIGGGVPAVVAMHGKVSDRSAGLFGPELLKGVAVNRTVDEAMAAARRRISYQPGHTVAEWATPALFLHEECRHGWLFKAREVRDGAHEAPDPLRRGAAAWKAYDDPTGDVLASQLIEAARHQRQRRDWVVVRRILDTGTKVFHAEQEMLRREAAYELAWPKVEELCRHLAEGRRDRTAGTLDAIRQALPRGERAWLPVLAEEVRGLERLTGLLDRARAAERAADWTAVLRLGGEILTERPDGFADTERLCGTADLEVAVAGFCARAEEACAAADWTGAADAWGEALALRADHGPALAGTAYARGRTAESAGDWPAAADAFGICPGLYDAAARGAFARGRAAAADDDWAGAHEAFRTARDHTTVNPAAQAPDSPAPPAPPRPTSGTSSPQPSPPPPSPESTPSPSANGHSTPAAPDNRPDTPPPSAPDSTEAAHPTASPANTPPPHPTSPPAPDAPPSPGLSDWVGYAAGRVAESGERWAEAEGLFGGVVGFADAGLRACHARGRAAAEAGAWARALAAMEAAVAERAAVTASHPVPAGAAPATGDADRLPEPAAWLGELRARVYEEAVAAADAGSWEEASAALRLLPDDHEDVARRRRFARGRAAEARGEWTGAAEAYREADHPDAGFRRRYALGRAAVLAGEWGAACEHFAQVPGHVDDFPEPPAPLLLYARGRDAAARDDWKAVVEDFGGLPDSHADGDVGHRRRYARARLAERQDATRPDTWTAVLGHLDGVPDEALGGAVGLLRRKATALHALSLGELERARGPLEPYADVDDEFALLHGYVLARLAERDEEWAAALTGYRGLPGTHADVAPRTRYAAARVAEGTAAGAAEWREIAAAYEELAASFADDGGFADTVVRAGYARLRLAEAEEDWAEVCRGGAALRGHADAPLVTAYARGRLTEAERDWRRAADAFTGCGTYRDAPLRLAHCAGRLLEEQGRFAAAVESYGRAGPGHEGARARAARLRGVLRLSWVEGTVGEPLVADAFALLDGTFPYRALRDAGIGPGSSIAEVDNVSYLLMERHRANGWPWEEREAWNRLRNAGRRLELDALLYRWHAPTAIREAVARLAPDEASDPLEALCARFPKDAPLLLLVARGRDAGIEAWRERLERAPGDMAVVHALAVARLWQARESEHHGAWEHAVPVWEEALAFWAALLGDARYWEGWRAERAACYRHPVSAADLTKLRRDLGLWLSDRLTAGEQGHLDQDRPEQAAAYRELTALFEAELAGARVLREAGGLPSLPGGGRAPACGPRFARMLGLQESLAERVAELSAGARHGDEPGEFTVRRVRWAFSALSPAATLVEARRFEEALAALPALTGLTELPADCAGPGAAADPRAHVRECVHCRGFVERDPAYLRLPRRYARFAQDGAALAVQALLSLAQTALTGGPDGLDAALAHWARALRIAGRAGMRARTEGAVVQMLLGRIDALIDRDAEDRDAALDEAVALADRVRPVLRPLAGDLAGQLDAQSSLVLSMRGVWRASTRGRYGLPLDVPAAEADLRRALELNPESGHARDNLVRCLVFNLDERTDDPVGRLAVLEESIALLHTGLRQELARGYRETFGETLNLLERLVSERIGIDGLAELMRSMAQEQPVAERELAALAQSLTERARRSLDVPGEVPLAVHLLVRAARTDPRSAAVRGVLLAAVGRWRAVLGAVEGEEEHA
ncbi:MULTISPECIES: CHAT domain-containing protein [Streptomyces]|uniref:CHAT domain-containing protein n=1 Tax=Streptomyces doudnae TaxID=3075536 RepID=A0ABD5EUQ6_9ACTN|nr:MULTISPECIES: CHAT domain-containing protein [unclassified Streptomyces]MDT0438466.1 CHAT domain-containing protein [Streptomyces sp. DSM 41981]MYQ62171.1 CHAT domain-containing protein [Streptomyces sp. SID4950]SCD31942.1 CHAT domain-containing protein [Streptomyces sp. SolWspMP-5a-2]